MSDLRKELHVPGYFFDDGRYSGAVRVYFTAAFMRIDGGKADLALRVNGYLVAVEGLREADISDEWLTYSVPLDEGILRVGENTFDLSIDGGAAAVGGDQRLDYGRSFVWSADAWRKLDDIGELQVILERRPQPHTHSPMGPIPTAPPDDPAALPRLPWPPGPTPRDHEVRKRLRSIRGPGEAVIRRWIYRKIL